LTIAMAKRNSAENAGSTMPTIAFDESKPPIMAEAAKVTTTDNPTTAAIGQSEKRPTLTGAGRIASAYEYVVDSRDVVGVHGVSQAECVSQKRRAKQDRSVVEKQSATSRRNVCAYQKRINANKTVRRLASPQTNT